MAISLTVPQRTGRVVPDDLLVKVLGPCRYPSPLGLHLAPSAFSYVGQADRVLLEDRLSALVDRGSLALQAPSFELAGPRDKVFFDPTKLRCGIVTCGGLCPGINNVVRGLVLELTQGYGVRDILGFRYGYAGLVDRAPEPMVLTPRAVADIHHVGGTVLGTSRGEHDPRAMVNRLDELGIGILFVIGGDGTLRGAMKLAEEIHRRDLLIGVVGIPKTIDNDIHFTDKSFGFESAYSAAAEVIHGAHVEATGAKNGIALVKLMGRHSGFIACHASIASTDVDAVLVPEVPMQKGGARGLFAFLEQRLRENAHAVVVVAEGAGQELAASPDTVRATDPSGNVRLDDVGAHLRDTLVSHFQASGTGVTLKYIDPSYYVRSVPALPTDSLYCSNMARHAVHAAMAGNTELLIGRWHGRFVHVPMPLATRYRKQVDPRGDLWMSVLESTGQPSSWAS